MRDAHPIPTTAPREGVMLGVDLLRWVDAHRVRIFALLGYMYLVGFSFNLRLSPDTAGYLITGQRLAEGKPYHDPAGYADHLVPGYPVLVAAFYRVFGELAVPALLIFMLAVGLAGLYLVYRLARAVADRPTAVVVVLFAGINETVYRYTYRPMPDLLFYNGVLLTLWGWHRWHQKDRDTRWHAAALLAAGVALMAATRSVAGVVVAALALDAARRLIAARRWRALAAATLAAAALFAALHLLQAGPTLALTPDEQLVKQRLVDDLPQTLRYAATETGPRILTEYLAEATVGFGFSAPLSLPIGLLVLVAAARLWRTHTAWAILITLFLLQWLIVDVTPRYFIPIIPLLGFAWWKLAVDIERRVGLPHGRTLLILMLVLIPGGPIVKSINTMMLQRRQPYYRYYNAGKYEPFVPLADAIHDKLPDDALVIAGGNAPAELALLSGRDVRPDVRHVYDHPGPCYVVTPLDPNTTAHLAMGYLQLGLPLHGEMNNKGVGHEIRPLRRTGLTPDGPGGTTDRP